MQGIVIRYSYSGEEADWRQLIDTFVSAIEADGDLAGKFHYLVSVGKDGVSRTHVGQWDEQATVETLQSRDFFKTFAGALKEMAGDTLQTAPMTVYRSTV